MNTPIKAGQILGLHIAIDAAVPTITQGPTLANPEAIHDVAELRTELHRANEQLLAMGARQHSLENVLSQMGMTMSKLVLAFLGGRASEVADILADVCRRNVVITDGSQPTH